MTFKQQWHEKPLQSDFVNIDNIGMLSFDVREEMTSFYAKRVSL